MNPFWLKSRSWIRELSFAVQPVFVLRPGGHSVGRGAEVTSVDPRKWEQPLLRAENADLDIFSKRRPHKERRLLFPHHCRPESAVLDDCLGPPVPQRSLGDLRSARGNVHAVRLKLASSYSSSPVQFCIGFWAGPVAPPASHAVPGRGPPLPRGGGAREPVLFQQPRGQLEAFFQGA